MAAEPTDEVSVDTPTANVGRYDAFLSYAREDSKFADDELCGDLRARGHEIWIDRRDIQAGANWRDRIKRGIEACKALIFVISPDSVASDVCLQELEYAVELNKLIVPIVRRDVPESLLPAALRDFEWVWFRDGDDIGAATDRLVESLETDLHWRDEHTRLAARAREWLDSERDSSYLLRGSDLRSAETWFAEQESHRQAPTLEHSEYIARSRQAGQKKTRTVIGGLSVGLMVAIGLAIFALVQTNTAIDSQHLAESRQLAAQSVEQAPAAPQTAAALAVRAWETFPTQAAEAAVRRAFADFHVGRGLKVNSAVPEVITTDPSVNAVTAVAFSPNDHYLVTGSRDGVVRVWPWPMLSQPYIENEEEDEEVESVAFSADGKYVVSGHRDGHVNVWQWATRPHGISIDARQGAIEDAKFSPWEDGEIAVTGADGSLRLWRWRRSPVSTVVARHDGRARALFYLPSEHFGQILSGGADGVLRVWAVPPLPPGVHLGEEARAVVQHRPIAGMAMRSTSVVTSSADGALHVWNLPSAEESASMHVHGSPSATAISEDRVAVATGTRITVWYRDADVPESFTTGEGTIRAMAFSGTGDQLVSVADNGELRAWNLSRRAQGLDVFQTNTGAAGVALSSDGSKVALAGSDNVVRVWNLDAQARPPLLLREPPHTPGGRVTGSDIAFDPAGGYLAAGTVDGSALVWSLSDPSRSPRVARVSDHEVLAVAFSHDGRYLATASGGATQIWRWHSAAGVAASGASSSSGIESAVTFGPTDDTVATADGFGRVLVWRWNHGPDARVLPTPDRQEIDSLAFSSDGRHLVSGTLTGNLVRVWDVQTGSSVEAHEVGGAQWGVGFTSNARAVVSVAEDGTLNVWPWAEGGRPITVKAFAEPPAAEPLVEAATFDAQSGNVAAAGNGGLMVRQCLICEPIPEIVTRARREGLLSGSEG
jgi:WD40 repeat protein